MTITFDPTPLSAVYALAFGLLLGAGMAIGSYVASLILV